MKKRGAIGFRVSGHSVTELDGDVICDVNIMIETSPELTGALSKEKVDFAVECFDENAQPIFVIENEKLKNK